MEPTNMDTSSSWNMGAGQQAFLAGGQHARANAQHQVHQQGQAGPKQDGDEQRASCTGMR